jgi:hypothetical protein
MLPNPLAPFLRWHQARLQTHPYALNCAQSALLMAIGDGVAQRLEMGRSAGAGDGEGGGGAPPSHFDPARLLILTSWAAGVNAPFWTWWYRYLHVHWQGGKVAGWVLASASLSPVWNGAFFSYVTAANHVAKQQEGSMSAKISDKLSTQLVPTVVKSCCLWIPFNFVSRGSGQPPAALPLACSHAACSPSHCVAPRPPTARLLPLPFSRSRTRSLTCPPFDTLCNHAPLQMNFRYVPLDYRMLSGGLAALGWNVFLSIQANRAAAAAAAGAAPSPGSGAAAAASEKSVALR